jgi:hypothetical protein
MKQLSWDICNYTCELSCKHIFPLEVTSQEFRLAIPRPHFMITAEKARIACIHLMRVEDTKE